MSFNNYPAPRRSSQKHLGMILDSKLNFEEHLRTISTKVNKNIGLLRKLQKTLLRQSLRTISLDHILTMVMSYSTKVTTIQNWKGFNTTNIWTATNKQYNI